MINVDFTNVDAANGGEKFSLPAGGYICQIKTVENNSSREYIKCTYDVVFGDYKDWGADYEERTGWATPLKFNRSYREKARGYFKRFLDAVEASNTKSGYKWEGDENTLEGKYVGIVIAEKEYETKTGKIRTKPEAVDFIPCTDVQKGNFTVPERIKLEDVKQNEFTPVQESEDLPF